MKMTKRINSRRWESVGGIMGSVAMAPVWWADFIIKLERPEGSVFLDYIVERHQGKGVYAVTAHYSEENWTAHRVALAVEGIKQ